jgi:hypothetical protein
MVKNKKEEEKAKQAAIEKNFAKMMHKQQISIVSNEAFRTKTQSFELQFIKSHCDACRQQIQKDTLWYMLPQN